MEDSLIDLIGILYEAASDKDKWNLFIENLGTTFNCKSSWFFSQRSISNDVMFIHEHGASEEHLSSYIEHYASTNILISGDKPIDSGGSLTDVGRTIKNSDRVEKDTFECSEFYNDWLKPQDLYYALGATLIRENGIDSNMSVLRAYGCGDYSEEEIRAWRILVPHMQRAVSLHYRFLDLEYQKDITTNTFDRIATGIFLINYERRVVSMNLAARHLLDANDGLSVHRDGRLYTDSPIQRPPLISCWRGRSSTSGESTIRWGEPCR